LTTTSTDTTEHTERTVLSYVAVRPGTDVPPDLYLIAVPAGSLAVFHTTGDHPEALQRMWAATATEWFPANPWRLRPGPSILSILDHAPDFSTEIGRASCRERV